MSSPPPPLGDSPAPEVIEGYVRYLKKIAREKMGAGCQADIEASDLVSEVILEMVRHREQFATIPPPARPSWLRRVLLNRLTDSIRRAMAQRHGGGRSRVSLDSGSPACGDGALFDSQETPSRIASRGEQEELLRAALDSLSESDREIIQARDFDGLDFATIGARCNLSAEAARKRHERALRRLAERLAGEDDATPPPPQMRSA
jgi:RNA polymerase sigma factor (sigma-70 family)